MDAVFSEQSTITVNNCPGNITGLITDTFGNGIGGVNVRLFNDVNSDGIADDAIPVRSVFTTGLGQWSQVGLTPGNYVVVVTNPALYTLVSGIDTTDDLDIVPNTITTDLIIPVTIKPQEIDNSNNFTFTPNPGTIQGTVLDNLGNPIENAVINIYDDDDLNGVADGAVVATGLTNASGAYSISGLQSGKVSLGGPDKSYVIELEVPVGYTMVSGIDITNDLDLVPNTDTTDNIIPCSLGTAETDQHNNFIITL